MVAQLRRDMSVDVETRYALLFHVLGNAVSRVCILGHGGFRVLEDFVELINLETGIVEHYLQAVSSAIIAFEDVDQRGNVGVDLEKCEQDALGALNDRLIRAPLALVLRETGHSVDPAVSWATTFSWAART